METNTVYYLTLFVAIFTSVVLLLRNHFAGQPPAKSSNHCPCSHPIIGNLIAAVRNRHRFLDWASDLLSASPTRTIEVRAPLGLSRGICTADPLVVDRLLRSNFPNYVKGARFRSVLYDLLGRGIFNADTEIWAIQRKIASHVFTTRSLRSFAADVVRSELRLRLLPLLSASADSGNLVDLQDVLRRFSFDNISAIAFGTDPASLSNNTDQRLFFRAFDEAVEISSARFFSPLPFIWKSQRFLNIGSERRLRRAIRCIDEYAMKIIGLKEEEEEEQKQDLLSRFMAAMNQDEGELSLIFRDRKEKMRFLRDIVVSFVLAGKDSTSSGLTWFFWLISVNPRCEERIYAELLESGEDKSVYDDLKGLQYLHAAISESLRLYPPVPIDSRVAVADEVLPDGTHVRAGWFADYSAYAMARSEAVWGADCREFVPERWLDERGEFVPADASRFPVFHAGPRTCLGREMAYVQMKSVAAAVIRDFKVEAVATAGREDPPPYELSLTLRMKGGFPVRCTRRARG